MDQRHKQIVTKARQVLADSEKLTEATGINLTSFNVVLTEIIGLADSITVLEAEEARAKDAVAAAQREARAARETCETQFRALDAVVNQGRESARRAFETLAR